MRLKWVVSVSATIFSIVLITSMAYAVAGKSLTITNGGKKVPNKLVVQQRALDGTVTPLQQTREEDDRKVVVPLFSESGTIEAIDQDTGKVYTLMVPGGVLGTVMTRDGNYVSDLESVPVSLATAAGGAAGGAAAMTQRTTTGGNWFNTWVKEMGLREVRFIAAGGAGLSTGNVWGNARSDLGPFGTFQSMSDFGRLSGGLAKFGVEVVVPTVWGIENIQVGVAGNKFFGRSSTGRADLDPFTPGAEATQKHKITDAIDFYGGKQWNFRCPVGWETCYVSAKVGGSVVNTVDKITILEAGVTQSFKDCTRQIAPFWAVGLGIPAVNFGAGAVGYVYFDFAFRYVPSTQYDHRSQLGFQYQNRTDSYVDFNPTIGIGVAFDP